MTEGDLFYKIFLGNYCLNECCYKDCKYKLCHSAADIRIGDLWGKTYAGENKGTSAVLSFTSKGTEIIEELSSTSCSFEQILPSVATEGQMARPANSPWVKSFIFNSLKSKISLESIADRWCRIYQLSIIPKGHSTNSKESLEINHKIIWQNQQWEYSLCNESSTTARFFRRTP